MPAYPWEDPDFARHIGEDSIRFKKRHLKEYDTRTEVRDFHGIAEYGKTSLKLGALSKGFQQITERHGIKDAEVPQSKEYAQNGEGYRKEATLIMIQMDMTPTGIHQLGRRMKYTALWSFS